MSIFISFFSWLLCCCCFWGGGRGVVWLSIFSISWGLKLFFLQFALLNRTSHGCMVCRAVSLHVLQLKGGPWKPKVMTNSHPVLPRPRAIQVRWLLHYYIDLIWRHRRAPRRIGGQTWHCHVRYRHACSQRTNPCMPYRRAGPGPRTDWEAERQCALPAQHVRAARQVLTPNMASLLWRRDVNA